MFRIFVPGYGNVFVSAANQQAAITGALRFLESHNVTQKLNGADLDNLQAIPFSSGAVPQGATIVNSVGQDINTVSAGPDNKPAVAPPTGTGPNTGGGAGNPGGNNSLENALGVNISPNLHPQTPAATQGGSGTQTPAGAGPQQTIDQPTLEASLPTSAFNQFLKGRGVSPEGIGGQLASSQLGPAYNTFAFLNDLGLTPALNNGSQAAGPFSQYLNSGALGTRFSSDALKALQAIAGGGRLAEEPQFFDSNGNFMESQGARNLINLFQQASQAGRSPITTGLFTPSESTVLQRLQDQLFKSGGSMSTPFFQYLQSQFHVPGLAGAGA